MAVCGHLLNSAQRQARYCAIVLVMKCPHCLTGIHESFTQLGGAGFPQVTSKRGDVILPRSVTAFHQICPECLGIILKLRLSRSGQVDEDFIAFPKSIARPLPPDVVDPYRKDFAEAAAVLADSAKASAAISRRCLQMILRDCEKVKPSDLSKEIDEVLARGALPTYLGDSVDAIRNIGNFAAHPMKSTNTGEVIDVEPGEAEWLLDVLEGLFDFYFVQPAILKEKRSALDAKLADVKKPPMK